MAHHIKLIGFDLDGTLINSLPDIALSLNTALAEFGFAQAEESLVLTWIGNGAGVLFRKAAEWSGAKDKLSEAELSALEARFNALYGENVCNKSELFPNVLETLQALKDQGYLLAVVTNKPTHLVQPVLQAFQIEHFFAETLGGHSLPKIKPHPAPLYYLCGKFGLYPQEILFVGDSKNDILAARAAGCQSVGLTYGYNYNVPIAEDNPDFVCDDFAEILQVLAKISPLA